ncbi:MAG: 3D domain-containing protein [Sarcina sp.]
MKHKILSLSLAAMLVGAVSVQASATPTNQISENKAKYKELSSQILDLNSKVSDLNAQIANLNKVTNENDLKMKETENQIADTKTKISAVQQEINKKQQLLGVRISAMYKSQLNFNPLVFLLSSNNFGDFLSRLNAFSRIISLDDNMINSLLDSKKALDSDISSLNEKEATLTNLQDSTKKNIAELDQKKKEQETSIAQLNAQKTVVLSTIESNENELISYSINVINSPTSSLTELESAKTNLEDLLPQLSIESIQNKAQEAINTANGSINKLEQQQAQEKQQQLEAEQQQQAQQAQQKLEAEKQQQLEAEKQKEEQASQPINKPNNSSSTTASSSSSSSSNSNSTSSSTNSSANSSNSSSTSSNSNSSNSTSTSGYKEVLHVEATAYSGGTITAMGLKAVRDPNGISTIAVDPSVIPLGSKVYIPGYGYAIASDTGGAIKGNIIDLFMNSAQACTNWGRRNITIYVVAYPGQW